MKANDERTRFEATELPVVLSHYDLGVIESITEVARGSSKSPKVGIVCDRGKLLLKRRASARAHPDRVRFAQRVQNAVVAGGYPAPRIIATRDGRRGFVEHGGQVYELYEFIAGQTFQQTPSEAAAAGDALARFHQAVDVLSLEGFTPRGDFHDAAAIRTGLCAIGPTLSAHDSYSGDEAELAALIQGLLGTYNAAADAANATPYRDGPQGIIHADWHPGNLLFRGGKVVAVFDFDAVRRSQRIIDVANGALQFSMIARGDPATWPEHLDETRFEAFVSAYERVQRLGDDDRQALPHLMIEALIAECVQPIAETGSVGRWSGYRVLHMVCRNTAWINANLGRLAHV